MQNKVIGQYNGKDIYAGTDAEVSAQMFGSTKPTPNYSITSENIKPVVPTPIASTKENVDYGTLLNTSTAQVEANYEAQKKEVERFYEQAKNESKSISDLNYLLGNKEQDLNNEYSKKGADGKSVYDLESDLGRLTAESKSLSRERDMIPSIVQEQFKNTGATDRGVAPIETGKLRENALRNMDIAYQSDIMTNRFNSAVKMADRIVDVKYKKLEAEIEAKKTNLASLEKYDLSPAEKRLAESTSRKLELEKEELNRKKENEKLMQNLIIKGAEQKAPPEVLANAQKGKTPQEVAIALGPWAGDFWQMENYREEIKKKALENRQTETDLNSGSFGNSFGGATSTITATMGIDPNTPLSSIIGNQSQMSTLVDLIVKQEGNVLKTDANGNLYRISQTGKIINNPGNIKYTGLPGQTNSGAKATDGGTFANYNTLEQGKNAIANLIKNAAANKSASYGQNPSLGKFIDIYKGEYNPNKSQYSSLTSTILASGKFTKDQVSQIKKAINSGSDPVTVIKNNAKNLLGQTEANELLATERSLESMKALQTALTNYYNAGGDTGILTGKWENAVNALGKVNDPGKAAFAVQVQTALQKYRKDISGTAFGVQEASDIESVFPSIKKGQILNDIVVKERIKDFERTIDTTYGSVLGSEYEKIKTSTNLNTAKTNYVSQHESAKSNNNKAKMPFSTFINNVN